jgi:hypothetical protein
MVLSAGLHDVPRAADGQLIDNEVELPMPSNKSSNFFVFQCDCLDDISKLEEIYNGWVLK